MPGFDNVEDNAGTVVQPFDQKDTIEALAAQSEAALGTPQPVDQATKGGVCHALSTLWIVRSAKGENFWTDLDTPETLAFVKQGQHTEASAMKLAAAVVGTADKFGGFDRRETMEKLALMKLFGTLPDGAEEAINKVGEAKRNWSPHTIMEQTGMGKSHSPTTETAMELAAALTRQEGYGLLTVQFPEGGHSMAVYNRPDMGVQFMDPNYGEAVFADKAQFERWLVGHIAGYEGSLGDAKGMYFDSYRNPNPPRRPEMGQDTLPSVVAGVNERMARNEAEAMAAAEAAMASLAGIQNLRGGRRR